MFAVIKTGAKQYKVKVGDKVKVEKIEAKEGDKLTFDQVLFWSDGKEVKLGAPTLNGAKVEATVLQQTREKKVTVIKHNAKKRYKKKQGHKQPKTEVEIVNIVA